MRQRFDYELKNLKKDITKMGKVCENIFSLIKKHFENETITQDVLQKSYQQIEGWEKDIEKRCLQLLLCQQPVAGDLRLISASLKMVYDIKRIGIQASEILDLLIQEEVRTFVFKEVENMFLESIKMVKDSLRCFLFLDKKMADYVIKKDDEIDCCFAIIKKKLSDMFVQDKNVADQVLNLLMIAKYLEKIGDHTVNIAKWAIYAIDG